MTTVLFWSGGSAPAQTPPQPPLLPIDILELARQRVLLLPEIPTDSRPPQPVTWDWRRVVSGDGRILDFVPSSWSQQGGTCYLFATIGAAEVVVAYELWRKGYTGGSASGDLAFHLSPMTWMTCLDSAGHCSGVAAGVGEFIEDMGVVDNCVEPFIDPDVLGGPGIPHMSAARALHCPGDDHYAALYCGEGNCGMCKDQRYERIHPGLEGYPYHALCGPLQREQTETIVFDGLEAVGLHLDGNGSQADANRLANFIREHGPVVETVAWATTSGDITVCTPTNNAGGTHFIHLIGYDFTNPADPLFVVRNSHGDQPFTIHFNQWAGRYDWDDPSNSTGCGLTRSSFGFLGDDLEPRPISMLDDRSGTETNRGKVCDPDADGIPAPRHRREGDRAYLTNWMSQPCSAADWDIFTMDATVAARTPYFVHYPMSDNCPETANPGQEDGDGDGWGDLCDGEPGPGGRSHRFGYDLDGDGYEDSYDCEPNNPYLGPDLDGDGLCDAYIQPCGDDDHCRFLCRRACSGADEVWCHTRCDNMDPCIELADPDCHNWALCLFDGVGCDPHSQTFAACRRKYFGRTAPGCNLPKVESFHVGPKSTMTWWGRVPQWGYVSSGVSGSTYEVSFEAQGAQMALDQNGNPYLVPTHRDFSNVGTCTCDRLDGSGQWRTECNEWDRLCPARKEYRSDDSLVWNPIKAAECSDLAFMPDGLSNDEQQHVQADSLCYGRKLTFSPYGSPYWFEWDWKQTPKWGDWSTTMAAKLQASHARTKVRVAWPDTARAPVYDGQGAEVAYSRLLAVRETEWSSVHADPYLGEPFVIGKIPRVLGWDSGRRPPKEPYALLAFEPERNQLTLFTLGRATLGLERMVTVQAPGLEADTVTAAALTLAGPVAGPWPVAGGADQGEPVETLVVASQPAEGTVRLWAGQVGEGPVQLQPVALAEPGLPSLVQVRLVGFAPTQGLVLLGQGLQSQDTRILRIDLPTGQVTDLGLLPGPADHYQAVADPLRARIVLFESAHQAPGAAPGRVRIWSLSPLYGGMQEVTAGMQDQPEDLARTAPALWLDPVGNTLYIYGGERSGQVLADLWAFDMAAGRFEYLGDGPALDRPDPAFVADAWGRLAARSLVGASLEATATSLVVGGPSQPWRLARQSLVAPPFQGDATAVFDPLLSRPLLWPVAGDQVWPGQWLLADLETAGRGLGLEVRGSDGLLLRPARTGDATLPLLAPPGEACWVRVTGGPDQAGQAYRLRVRPAQPVLVSESRPRGIVTDLQAGLQGVYASGLWGLAWTADPSGGSWALRRGRRYRGLTGLVRCGRGLCASRLGGKGLVMYRETGNGPQVAWAARTRGLALDLASYRDRVYVATVPFGLAEYRLSGWAAPTLVGSHLPWQMVTSLAVRGGRLAVGLACGQVRILDTEAGLAEQARVDVPFVVRRVRFVAGRLWVLGPGGRAVVLAPVPSDQGLHWEQAGQVDEDGDLWARWQWYGDVGVTFSGRQVKVYDLEVE